MGFLELVPALDQDQDENGGKEAALLIEGVAPRCAIASRTTPSTHLPSLLHSLPAQFHPLLPQLALTSSVSGE